MTASGRREAVHALSVAAPPWVLARAIVLGTLALSHYLLNHLHIGGAGVAFRVHQGLLGWDAGFYQAIAVHGYGGLGHQSLRFFPLVPMLARGLSTVTPLTAGGALLVISNVASLVAGAMLYKLAVQEKRDERLGRRAAWLLALVPPAFVLVMGYAEPVLLVLGIGTFMALRRRRWGWAALAGLLAGLTRPVGFLLAVPAVIEVLRPAAQSLPAAPGNPASEARAAPGAAMAALSPHTREAEPTRQGGWTVAREDAWKLSAVLGPLAGTAAFLLWVGQSFGDALLPYKVQSESNLRGGLTNPFAALAHNASGIVHGHVGSALHVPWALGLAVLVVIAFRLWPAPYGAFAAASLLLALTSVNLDSIERYGLAAFPLVLAGASLTASQRVERAVLILAGAGLVAYGLLAFLNAYIP